MVLSGFLSGSTVAVFAVLSVFAYISGSFEKRSPAGVLLALFCLSQSAAFGLVFFGNTSALSLISDFLFRISPLLLWVGFFTGKGRGLNYWPLTPAIMAAFGALGFAVSGMAFYFTDFLYAIIFGISALLFVIMNRKEIRLSDFRIPILASFLTVLFLLIGAFAFPVASQLRRFLAFGSVIPAAVFIFLKNSLLVHAYRRAVQTISELKEGDEKRDSLLFSTAHELRSPLQGILGLAESLLHDGYAPLSADQKRSVEMISSSGQRMSHLIRDLLDYRDIQRSKFRLDLKPVNLRSLINSVLKTLEHSYIGKDIVIESKIDNLPFVNADEKRIEQVLINLVGNALKFTQEGTVKIDADVKGGFVQVSISDNGPGLQTTDIGVLAGDAGEVPQRGAGLGLTISRSIMEAHGCNLTAANAPGGGACFTISLPVSQILAKPAFDDAVFAELTEDLETTISQEDNPVLPVIVIDDDTANLQAMKNHILGMYPLVECFSQPVKALERIRAKMPKLIVLDINMPVMDGYTLCRAVREIYTKDQVPVIMMTARNQLKDMIEGYAAGANDYVTKPFTREEILSRISLILEFENMVHIYSSLVDEQFMKQMGYTRLSEMKTGDQVDREMSVLFLDIRGFTALSEQMTPHENFKFINSFLARFSPIIKKHNGFVDKYIGDSIMALFPGTADDAVGAAKEMVEKLHIYNGHRANCSYRAIGLGIGIHTGNLILGVIGDGDRMQGTVISDAVNLASRIEGATKLYKTNILISQETFVRLENPMDYHFRFLGKVRVKGKERSVSLFEIFDCDPPEVIKLKEKSKGDFEQGILMFAKRQFSRSYALFAGIAAQNTEDTAAQLFTSRARQFMAAQSPVAK